MEISKRTLPSVPGGLMNKAFQYRGAANTDIQATFDRVRAEAAKSAAAVKQINDPVRYLTRGGTRT